MATENSNLTSDILTEEFINNYKGKQPKWGFNGLGYIVYKRTYARIKPDGVSEEWWETVARCINGAQKIGAQYTREEAEELYDLIFNLKCSFPGRMLWQLGTTTVDRFGGNSLLNCWFCTIQKPEDFCFIFENLMLGGGVGFSIRREDVYQLPKIKSGVRVDIKNTKDADFIVPDSREGWVALLQKVLDAYFKTGKGFTYSTILIRGFGEAINGFGGTASGPKVLEEGIEKIKKILESREGKKIRSIDALDICNIIGSVVVAGNVRRSAQIALGDPDDVLFLKAKRWDLDAIPNWRAMSNNTIYADDYDHVMETVWDGYAGNGEPYGFFNLKLSQTQGRIGTKAKDQCLGLNPCQPYWAPVLTKFGIKKFGDIDIGEEIWSSEGWTKVVNKWSNGIKPVYEYRTTAGIFYGTENHRILSNGEKIEVDKADSIDILSGQYCSDLTIDAQDVMDGLVIGDGNVHKASNNLITLLIGEDDQDYFSSEIGPLIKKHRPGITEEAYEIQTTIKPEELPLTFNREIPERFLYNKNKLVGFLRGLFTANGSVIRDTRISLKTTSPKLRDQVQIALSSLGIRSYYTTNKPSLVKFKNGDYVCKESYDINITVDKKKFADIIGFIQAYKNFKLTRFQNSNSTHGKKTFDIISKSFIAEEEVFDITVDNESHTYWTGGFNVSNCGEITLANYECCNLAELFLNNIESKSELITAAKLLYKTQKAIAALPFIHEETNKIVRKNMRLGLSVTGICQSLNKVEWLDECYNELREYDKSWSEQRNWPESIKLTTVKPSGTVSLLAGSTPGIHPAYAQYYIRRVRMSASDKLVPLCREMGYGVENQLNFDGTVNRDTVVVSFPCAVDSGSILTKDMSAIRQLELVKQIQTVWADNAVSCTVYYRKSELDDIKNWLRDNYKTSIKSVSFMLHSDHGFAQAPYEEITEEKFLATANKVKSLESLFGQVGGGDLESMECSGGACPIK